MNYVLTDHVLQQLVCMKASRVLCFAVLLPGLHVELIMKWYKLPLITPMVVAALMKFDIQFSAEIYDTQFLHRCSCCWDHFAGDVILSQFKVHFSTLQKLFSMKRKALA